MQTLTRYAALAALAACTASALAAEPAMDEAARMQYALGYQLGKDLAGVELRAQDLQRGLEDGRSGAKARLSDEEMNAALTALQERVNAQRAKAQAAEAEKAVAAGQAYLDANAKKPGVTTTASGLQYRVITSGSGAKPKASDTVTVHYKGTLVDGTEFDSSYKRGQPASFPVGGVIPGWTEALQLMPIGSKYELAIPPALAYGSQGPLANQVLLFEVELLGTTADSADVQK
ncbi:MAG TPA: FKBP-type peptidyl-prolyl cis-trans isomerase [Steroidobacteraceae bacterium]|nr:FKBP-type peptidyl-prolyl cis-trans isomerase [Steroidobacteraceae bacterium]